MCGAYIVWLAENGSFCSLLGCWVYACYLGIATRMGRMHGWRIHWETKHGGDGRMHLDVWIATVEVVKVEKKRFRGCSDALLVVEILHLVVPFDFSPAPLQTFPDETRGIAVAGQKAAISRIAARRYPRRTSRRLCKSCSMHPKRRTLTTPCPAATSWRCKWTLSDQADMHSPTQKHGAAAV